MSEARRFRLFSILHREQLHAARFVFFFLVGAGAGSLVGVRSPSDAAAGVLDKLAAGVPGAASYFWGLWTMAWPSLVAVFFATSVVGFLLLPGLFFWRQRELGANRKEREERKSTSIPLHARIFSPT